MILVKYDGRMHRRQTMRHLGEDEFGDWFGAAAGSVIHRTAQPSFTTKYAAVRLLAPAQWWTVTFAAEPDEWQLYCDICTPAVWTSDAEVVLTDLDLDLYLTRADQRVELLDEDEFATHQHTYGYPPDVVRHATDTAQRLRTQLAHTEPFTTRYRSWLDLAREL